MIFFISHLHLTPPPSYREKW